MPLPDESKQASVSSLIKRWQQQEGDAASGKEVVPLPKGYPTMMNTASIGRVAAARYSLDSSNSSSIGLSGGAKIDSSFLTQRSVSAATFARKSTVPLKDLFSTAANSATASLPASESSPCPPSDSVKEEAAPSQDDVKANSSPSNRKTESASAAAKSSSSQSTVTPAKKSRLSLAKTSPAKVPSQGKKAGKAAVAGTPSKSRMSAKSSFHAKDASEPNGKTMSASSSSSSVTAPTAASKQRARATAEAMRSAESAKASASSSSSPATSKLTSAPAASSGTKSAATKSIPRLSATSSVTGKAVSSVPAPSQTRTPKKTLESQRVTKTSPSKVPMSATKRTAKAEDTPVVSEASEPVVLASVTAQPVIENALLVSAASLLSPDLLAEEHEANPAHSDAASSFADEAPLRTVDVTSVSEAPATPSEGDTVALPKEGSVECVSNTSAVEEQTSAVDDLATPLHGTSEGSTPPEHDGEAERTPNDVSERCTTPDSLPEPICGESDDGFSSSSNSAITVSDDHTSIDKDGESSAPYTPLKSASSFQHTIPFTPTTYTPTGRTLEDILRAADRAMGDSEDHEYMTMLDDSSQM